MKIWHDIRSLEQENRSIGAYPSTGRGVEWWVVPDTHPSEQKIRVSVALALEVGRPRGDLGFYHKNIEFVENFDKSENF